MIKIAIIGGGKIAQIRHIPEYLANGNVEIVAVFDIHLDRAQEIASKLGATAYDDYKKLIENEELDAVSICTPNSTHAEITNFALEHGLHVLVEKPMATCIEDCQAMVDTAEKNKKLLMVGQNQRLTKAHMKARELLLNGEIGDLLVIKTSFGHSGPETWGISPGKNTWFFDKKRAVMGSMADLGVHKLDLVCYLTNQKIVDIYTKATTLDKKDADDNLIGVDDNSISVFTLESGAIGTMNSSWTYYAKEDNSTYLYGTKGQMEIYADPNYALVVRKKDELIKYDIEMIQTNDNQTSTGIINEFVSSIIENRESIISGKSVLATMKAVFAGLESNNDGSMHQIIHEED